MRNNFQQFKPTFDIIIFHHYSCLYRDVYKNQQLYYNNYSMDTPKKKCMEM